MLDILPALASLGGTVTVTAMFLWYIQKKDTQSAAVATSGHKVAADLAAAINEMTTELALHKEILRDIGDDIKESAAATKSAANRLDKAS